MIVCSKCNEKPYFSDGQLECLTEGCNWFADGEIEQEAIATGLEQGDLTNTEKHKAKAALTIVIEIDGESYCIDGISLKKVYLEKILLMGGVFNLESPYTEQYRSVPTLEFLKLLLLELFYAWKKERELSKH
ncbi:MAG: hypothetical protein VKL42_08925 [Snowella sp.]|nr:hypothetical protein [Snowella sp.]